MAVPGWPSPAFWMASMARDRTVSTARVSRSVPRAVSVVTAAPRGGFDVLVPDLGYPLTRPDHRSGGLVALAAGAGLHAPAQGQLAQPPLGGDPALTLARLAPLPAAVLQQLPGLDVVGQHDVQDLLEPAGQVGVGDRGDHLDPQVEVAGHQVGRADVVLAAAAVGEGPDAAVLQEPANDGPHPDGVAHPRDPRAQPADAPHDQVDLHPGLGGAVQGADALGVDQRVHLQGDAARAAAGVPLGGPLDQLDDPFAQEVGGDQDLAVAGPAGVPGERVEQLGQVGAQVLVTRQQAQVGVEPGRLGVVVAGADVDVAADAALLDADHQGGLGVGLEPDQAVGDVAAGPLQRPGPADVGGLVAARLHLHQHHHLYRTDGD